MRDLLHKLILNLNTIEQRRRLLQGHVASLDEQEINNEELDSEPDVVDNVIFPANVRQRDGVCVLVEDQGTGDEQVVENESLGDISIL